MRVVIQRNTDKYFYRGRNSYPRWVNQVELAHIYTNAGAAKNAISWCLTQPEFLDIVPVTITLA